MNKEDKTTRPSLAHTHRLQDRLTLDDKREENSGERSELRQGGERTPHSFAYREGRKRRETYTGNTVDQRSSLHPLNESDGRDTKEVLTEGIASARGWEARVQVRAWWSTKSGSQLAVSARNVNRFSVRVRERQSREEIEVLRVHAYPGGRKDPGTW